MKKLVLDWNVWLRGDQLPDREFIASLEDKLLSVLVEYGLRPDSVTEGPHTFIPSLLVFSLKDRKDYATRSPL